MSCCKTLFAILLVALNLIKFSYQQCTSNEPQILINFFQNIERLVMKTSDDAIEFTHNVYKNLSLDATLSATLKAAIQPILNNYVQQIEQISCNSTYMQKRDALRLFKWHNQRIEELRQKHEPKQPKFEFEFQLISDDFLQRRENITQFDNLYLKFMYDFQMYSNELLNNISLEFAEEQQDLVNILKDISEQEDLRERDKLYDEFIEMFLFRSDDLIKTNKELE